MIWINWHSESQTMMNRFFIGTIRTGQTQAVTNWLASLAVTRQTHLRYQLHATIEGIATKGAPLEVNIPECDLVEMGGRTFAVVYGIKGKGETLRGRQWGEYKFVICLADDPDERLPLTNQLFQLSKRLGKVRT
jgi:hypothetical protein